MTRQNLQALSSLSALALAIGMSTPVYSLDQGWMIEEVVVTAQKREQSLNDVSVAVNAASAEDIKTLRMSSPNDIAAIAPNVDFKSTLGGANPAITIRGIGLNDFNVNNNPSVGVYVDEVFVTSPAMMNFTMFDIDRVEVLKGPQGTLYGRNSNGGAINIIAAQPTSETQAYVTAGVGDYQMREVEGALGGALSESVSGRISFRYDDREGYHDNVVTGGDLGFNQTQAVRAQLAYDNGESFTASIGYTHGEQEFGTIPFANFGVINPVDGSLCGNSAILANRCVNDQGWQRPSDNPLKHWLTSEEESLFNSNDVESDMAVVKLNWDLGDYSVTSVTGWSRLDRDWAEGASDHDPQAQTNITLDGRSTGIVSAITKDERIEQFSQELRLSYAEDGYSWMLGVFFSEDDVDTDNYADFKNLPLIGFDARWAYQQETRSGALFASGEIELSDTLTLNLGLRYSEEERDFEGATYAYFDALAVDVVDLFFVGALTPAATLAEATIATSQWSTQDSIDEEQLSGRVGLDYRPNNDLLIYGYVANGFKSGGFVGDFVFDQIAYEPYDSEEVVAWEAGFKSTLLDSTMQLNGAVFYYDYQDMQTLVPVDTPAGTVFPLANADQASVAGLELELQWLPLQGLELRAGLGYLDHELDDEGLGDHIPSTADLQLTGLVRYEFDVAEGVTLALQSDFKYTDSKYIEAFNMDLLETDAYTTVNARAALSDEAGKWELALWGKNLGDEQYHGFGFDLGTFNGTAGYMFEAPRTYGMSLTFHYH
jgi:iron complex outermembrane receptor protein